VNDQNWKIRLGNVRLLAFDVDGVFTDGRFYLSDDGVESKAFHTHDGFGIRQVVEAGIKVAVISGRHSAAVQQRMQELGVQHIYLGCGNKVATFEDLLKTLELTYSQSAYTGDDIPDMALLQKCAVSFAVANAHAEVKAACDYTTLKAGGHGAVREICDLLLAALPQETDRQP
jgi:3-deoxy-D-manno-octulosonate 8-phosphate phosphatase (KDO 8-P phosphatase)